MAFAGVQSDVDGADADDYQDAFADVVVGRQGAGAVRIVSAPCAPLGHNTALTAWRCQAVAQVEVGDLEQGTFVFPDSLLDQSAAGIQDAGKNEDRWSLAFGRRVAPSEEPRSRNMASRAETRASPGPTWTGARSLFGELYQVESGPGCWPRSRSGSGTETRTAATTGVNTERHWRVRDFRARSAASWSSTSGRPTRPSPCTADRIAGDADFCAKDADPVIQVGSGVARQGGDAGGSRAGRARSAAAGRGWAETCAKACPPTSPAPNPASPPEW